MLTSCPGTEGRHYTLCNFTVWEIVKFQVGKTEKIPWISSGGEVHPPPPPPSAPAWVADPTNMNRPLQPRTYLGPGTRQDSS